MKFLSFDFFGIGCVKDLFHQNFLLRISKNTKSFYTLMKVELTFLDDIILLKFGVLF